MLRYLLMAGLACTGVGLIYMLARIRWVSPGCVGVVRNYYTQEYEELEPGVHCILNPLSTYVKEVSKQTEVVTLPSFTVKSRDNVDAVVETNISYNMENPLLYYQKVRDPDHAFFEHVKTAFSSAIQTLKFSQVTTADINRLAEEAENYDDESVEKKKQEISFENKDDMEQSQLFKNGAAFFKTLSKICKEWGISISLLRINSIEAKRDSISEALELTAETEVRANAQLQAVNSQAKVIQTLAEAEKNAQITRAEGAAIAAEILNKNKGAMEVYIQETKVRVAHELGRSGNVNLMLTQDMDNNFYRSGGAAMTTFNKRPRSLSTGDLNQRIRLGKTYSK